MKAIHEYDLYNGPVEDYHSIRIPPLTELTLPRDSKVLSVLSERNSASFSVKAYVEENGELQTVTKKIALVTSRTPDENGIGWTFVNSLVISTGPKEHPQNTSYHAYVKVC